MSSNPSVIIGRKAGEAVDNEFLDKIAAEYSGYIGCAFTETEEGVSQITHVTDVSLQDLKDTIADTDSAIYAIFGKEAIAEDHRQPIILFDKDTDTVLCAVLLEGDFKSKPNSTVPDEFGIVQNYLLEKIIETFQDCENDSAKTLAKLNRTTTHRDILANVSPGDSGRCEILLLFPTGETVQIQKGNTHRSFDWGFSSQALDPPTKETLSLPAAQEVRGLARLKKNLANNAVGAALTAAVAAKTSVPTVPAAKEYPPGGSPLEVAAAAVPEQLILPSKGRTTSIANLKGWYETYGLFIPDGFEQGVDNWNACIPVPAKAKFIAGNKSEQQFFRKAVKEGRVVEYDSDKHPRSKVSPLPDTTAAAVADSKSAGAGPAILHTPAAERDKIVKVRTEIIKSRDDNHKLVVNPAKVQEYLKASAPLATAEIGLSGGLDDLNGYSEDAFYEFAKASPRWVARLLSQYNLARQMSKGASSGKDQKLAM